MNSVVCPDCNGNGYLFCESSGSSNPKNRIPHYEKCDTCNKFQTDAEADEVAKKIR